MSTGIDSSEHGKLSHLLRTELFCLYLVTMTAASMSHAAEQSLALTLKGKTVKMEAEPIDGTREGCLNSKINYQEPVLLGFTVKYFIA